MPAIVAHGLHKHFGSLHALDDVDLDVPEGHVLGLLGPNGAGKTTTVRILTTLLRPDAGEVRIAGVDALAAPTEVRRRIGVAGQYAAVDDYLTGRENLVMIARLNQMPARKARARADELLDQFGLRAAADRLTKNYSGGMRRRLDLAAAIVDRPEVLFLDEPTTGLDPRSRTQVWDSIGDLCRLGTTLLLTTQYLEEADRLADTIAVIDHGRIIARGRPDELKRNAGGQRLEVVIADPTQLEQAIRLVRTVAIADIDVDAAGRSITAPVTGIDALTETVRCFAAHGLALDDIALRRPSLDEVFLALTGHAAVEADA